MTSNLGKINAIANFVNSIENICDTYEGVIKQKASIGLPFMDGLCRYRTTLKNKLVDLKK